MLVLSRGDSSAPGPALLGGLLDSYGLGRTLQPGIAVVGSGLRGMERHPSVHGLVFTAAGLAVVGVQEVVGQSGYLFAPAHGSWTVAGQMVRLRDGGSNPAATTDAGLKTLVATLRRGGIDPGYVQSLIVIAGEVSGVAQPETERGVGVVVVRAMAEDVAEGVVRATIQVAGGLAQLWTSADVVAALRILGMDTSAVPTEAITNEGFPYSPYVLRPTSLDDLSYPGEDDFGQPATAGATRPAQRSVGDPMTSDTNTVPGVSLLQNADVPAVAAMPPAPRPVAPIGRHDVVEPAPSILGPEPTEPERRSGPLRWVAVLAVLAVIGAGIVFGARVLFGSDDQAGGGAPSGPSATNTGPTVAGESTPPPAPQTLGAFSMTYGAGNTETNCAAHARGKVQEFLAATKCTTMSRALLLTTSAGRSIVISVSDVTMPDAASATGLKQTLDSNGTGNVNTLLAEGVYPDGVPKQDLFDAGQAYASQQTGAVVRVVETAWADGKATAAGDATEQAAEAALAAKLP